MLSRHPPSSRIPQTPWMQSALSQPMGPIAKAPPHYPTFIRPGPAHREAVHLEALHQEALLAYQSKNYVKAAKLLRRALGIQPQQAALHASLALVLEGLGQPEEAVAALDEALRLAPDLADAHSNRGGILSSLQRWDDALNSLDQAIALAPAHVDAHFNRAALHLACARWEQAATDLERVLQQRPNHVEAWCMHANAMQELQAWDAACVSLARALVLDPRCTAAHFQCGYLQFIRCDYVQAIASFEQVIALDPQSATAFYNRGNAQRLLKQWQAALDSYDRAIAIAPDYADAYNNRGLVLKELKQMDAALESYGKSLRLQPHDVSAASNQGNALLYMGALEEALNDYNRALALKPDFVEALSNRGNALMRLHRLDEALQSFDQAIALSPDYAEAHWNKSYVCLLQGDYATGWALHEWRWKSMLAASQRHFAQPLWLGETSIQGKTLLLHAEQGLGDTLQFCRYIWLIVDQLGAKVVLEVQPPLAALLQPLSPMAHIISRGEPLPAFDCHCPLLSLPLAFQTRLETVPAAPSYLYSEPSKRLHWQNKLQQKCSAENAALPKVGLVWSGNPDHSNDRNRSLRLAQILRHLPSGCQYISLQKEVRQADLESLQQASNVVHFGQELQDFSDTAALCDLMDLVISVDTSVAHLSGALGKPTWILLPHVPDWRWLLARSDSPWYPSVQLYRQKNRIDWDGVLTQVAQDLRRTLCLDAQP